MAPDVDQAPADRHVAPPARPRFAFVDEHPAAVRVGAFLDRPLFCHHPDCRCDDVCGHDVPRVSRAFQRQVVLTRSATQGKCHWRPVHVRLEGSSDGRPHGPARHIQLEGRSEDPSQLRQSRPGRVVLQIVDSIGPTLQEGPAKRGFGETFEELTGSQMVTPAAVDQIKTWFECPVDRYVRWQTPPSVIDI
jgi:hypothetical protein